jgi:hypothetical protein
MERTPWVSPRLVRKPVSETAGGLGGSLDALGGEFLLS